MHDAAAVFGDPRRDQVEVAAQGAVGGVFVLPGQVTVTGDIGV